MMTLMMMMADEWPSTKPMVATVAERLQRQEDVLILECVWSKKLVEYLHKRLGALYDVQSIVLDVLHDLGDPVARKRLLTVALLKRTVKLTAKVEQLREVFSCQLVADGDIYFCMAAKSSSSSSWPMATVIISHQSSESTSSAAVISLSCRTCRLGSPGPGWLARVTRISGPS